jgi:hypothetical protein
MTTELLSAPSEAVAAPTDGSALLQHLTERISFHLHCSEHQRPTSLSRFLPRITEEFRACCFLLTADRAW